MAYWLVSIGPKDEPGIDGAIVVWFCYCQDPDGNMFGLLEPMPGPMPSGS